MLKGWEDMGSLPNFIDENFIGVYALSRNGLNVHYIGRSFSKLIKMIEREASDPYLFFAYEYTLSDVYAYRLECKYYHECKPPDNTSHPVEPEGSNLLCPVKTCRRNRKLILLYGNKEKTNIHS